MEIMETLHHLVVPISEELDYIRDPTWRKISSVHHKAVVFRISEVEFARRKLQALNETRIPKA